MASRPENPIPNPYLSPRVSSPGTVAPEDSIFLGTYEPIAMPQDGLDLLWACLCAVIVVPIVYGIPLGVLTLIHAPLGALAGAVLVVVAIAIACMTVGVRKIELTPEGVVAARRWLGPIRIPWREVERLERAPWLELLFTSVIRPHRCCSFSMTCHHQVAIRGPAGTVIFPPREIGMFTATIRHCAGQANPAFVDATVQHGA